MTKSSIAIRISHPHRSSSGVSSSSSGYPTHKYPTNAQSSSTPKSLLNLFASNMLTHPTPIPTLLAVSQNDVMALTTLYRLISGIVCAPRPAPLAVASSQNMASWTGASFIPESFSLA
eukprot:CAMPEP_0196252350 /NCGR_PEP_ID=MMETSP0913-20130531/49362_1 /TAXON_ID=49265 /ORGANISM="Thalassiosira rotula, Strain GSO102" /LENGTH=117 /DNA_ID=CAMNT_0041538919 /DNA_START=86 /DNA_END=435 /DNA_ORIENTATION=+